jgi:hypothetical protein
MLAASDVRTEARDGCRVRVTTPTISIIAMSHRTINGRKAKLPFRQLGNDDEYIGRIFRLASSYLRPKC